MKLTVAVDQFGNKPFHTEFGLALVLEHKKHTFLLDCGAGDALIPNLKLLGKTEASEKVILTHGHYDHTGGLKDLAPEMIWCCEGVLAPHYSFHADGSIHHISMPDDSANVLKRSHVKIVNGLEEIVPGLFLAGPIERVTSEDCGGNFFHDESGLKKDLVEEELSVLTEDGVLVSGCCHAGLMNTIHHCKKYLPQIHIRTVAGGLHLRNASPERLEETASFLREHNVRNLILMHCTGENAVAYLRDALPECRVVTLQVGQNLDTMPL